VKVLAINIRAGGTRSTIDRLLEKCLSHDCDTLVLAEFRENPLGIRARSTLLGAGYRHQSSSVERGATGVLIASRDAFEAIRNPLGLASDEYPGAILESIFAEMRLFGVYLPGQDRKRPHLRCLIATAEHFNDAAIPALCIGDFNSGRNETDIERNLGRSRLADEFSTAGLYAELERHWTEAWLSFHPDRHEFSWYPFRLAEQPRQRNGWRIDKAFVSPALLERVEFADYDHTFRTQRLTDHSALIVGVRRSAT
jgi:exonuclease III